ncbi:MAG: transcription-repair coupling factor [Acidobacteriota bacterium]
MSDDAFHDASTESPTDVWTAHAEAFEQSETYVDLARAVANGDDGARLTRLPIPAAAWILGRLAAALDRPMLVVVPQEADGYAWLEASRLFLGDDACAYVPAPSLSPYQETDASLMVRAEEAAALDRIVAGRVRTAVCTPRVLFQRLPTAASLDTRTRRIAPDEEHPVEDLAAYLVDHGYRRTDLVVEVGEFAVRGGVFDFFPPGHPQPVRLDLFGDTVESIQRFDPESQRSLARLDAVRIAPLSAYPASPDDARRLADRLEDLLDLAAPGGQVGQRLSVLRHGDGFDGWRNYLPLCADETVDLASLLGGPDAPPPLVVAVQPAQLDEEIARHADDLEADWQDRVADDRLAVPPAHMQHPADAVRDRLRSASVRLGDLIDDRAAAAATNLDFRAGWTDQLQDHVLRFKQEVEAARGRGDAVVVCVHPDHRRHLVELVRTLELEPETHPVAIVEGQLQRGFRLPAARCMVFGERQLLRHARAAPRRKKPGNAFGPFLTSLRDLKVGDYVVHVDHGIGQFVGLRNLGGELAPSTTAAGSTAPASLDGLGTTEAIATEVMEISYASGKRLLLPLSRIDQIQKYSGIEGLAPRLDKLGGSSWKRTKSRIKKGMRDMAEELLKLYAARQVAEAPRMPADSSLQDQFEAAFVHDPTEDQQTATAAIKVDLESRRPMDRLLCGDVGFGKTEVAMRAAFKAVDSGYQVAVLAPTTILADQHLQTFRQRFRGFPVTVDMVSRFRTNAEVRAVQKAVEAGKVDILIGTHRLLNRGFQFPKLGLLVIDEEQRFGVAQKEKLKKIRQDVHVLAMSATPVPRTLQLSLAGIRELSLIETPPRDRMAVETAIVPFDGRLVREAMQFEFDRGGQVFYVYNEVETIERMAGFLREAMPGLKLTVGHGQLDEKELAKRMHAFIAGEHQLLLATTIIENGIDIPNVNTIIVHNAHRFGLSQLYQLRGRVGRSDRLGFCYLVVPRDRVLSQDARKRLEAIREFTELGAGFRVAGRDLEIRGAGNLLGGEQSGHIAAVGIETYLRLLQETVAEMRGEPPEEAPSVAMDLPLPMAIPEDYVGDPSLRMDLYRRIAVGDTAPEALLQELRDRFGPPPAGIFTLIEASSVKRLAEALRLQSIAARSGRLIIRLRQDARIDPTRLIEMVQADKGVRFSPDGVLSVANVPTAKLLARTRQLLERMAPEDLPLDALTQPAQPTAGVSLLGGGTA